MHFMYFLFDSATLINSYSQTEKKKKPILQNNEL